MGFLEKKFFSKITNFIVSLAGVVLLFSSPPAIAAVPNISGNYSGSGTDTDSNCGTGSPGNSPLFSGDTESVSIIMTVTQSGTSFSGSGEETFPDATVDDFTFSGSVDSSGNISGSWNSVFEDGALASGTFNGNVVNGVMTVTGSGSQTTTPNPVCDIDFSWTLSLGGNVINSEITPSSTVTDVFLFNTQIQGTISDISKHITGALGGRRFFGGPRVTDNQFKLEGATGLNAGDGSSIPYGVWGSYSYTDFENDLSSTAFDGISHSFLGGIDFGFLENTVLGVAFGYDNGDIDTTFNRGHQDTDTFTIAPYFGALLDDILSIDFTVGYSNVDYDQFRTLPGTTTRITSSPDADRWFGALNLNGVTYYDKWILGGRIGALFAKSVIDSFTESDGTVVAESRTKVGTASIAGDVAYSWQNYEPFLNLSYQNDFSLRKVTVTSGPQPSNDTDDILMTVGVRYFNKDGISGNLEYSKRFLRDNFDEDRISATVRVDF